ncbi:exported protein [Staphylococcus aureus]|uniref:Exported protein n=1 Tax=Staphylococcus aureus TaxID=1280 RepID=A0A8G2I4F9_STAAU|nr:exported protein [Staphylococcus aureus]
MLINFVEPDLVTLQNLKEKNKSINIENQKIKREIQELKNLKNDLISSIEEGTKELEHITSYLNDELFKYDIKLTYPFDLVEVDSSQINTYIKKLQMKEKELLNLEEVKIFNVSTENKRHQNAQAKQIIRLFNAETSQLINKVNSKNIESMQNKIFKSYEGINKIFETDNVRIPETLLDIKLEMLDLMHKYQVKIEDEKIIRREERARLKEIEQAEKEMEKKLKELDKDIRHHNNEIKKLTMYLNNTDLQVEKELYIEKIRELDQSLKDLNSERENVEDRKDNAQSGFVYIISNIGSFGENVYKIGVTRRLEPMDRINELSSASVPFEFDVHALIFSENAFELESKLHEYFKKYKVNKVNGRKEFFKVNINEIKDKVLSEHNSTVQFIDEPKAIQYRETLRLTSL